MNKKDIKITGLSSSEIEILKLLEMDRRFQSFIVELRKRFGVNSPAGTFDVSKCGWPDLNKIEELIYKLVSDIGIQVKNPFFFFKHIYGYMLYNKWSFNKDFPDKQRQYYNPPAKYKIINEPPAIFDKNENIIEPSKTVSLITYARLTTQELKYALEDLKFTQKKCMDPEFTKHTRQSKDIERDLQIVTEMQTRERPHKKEVLNDYLKIVKSQYQKGFLSGADYKKAIKSNPHDLSFRVEGKTSADIAVVHLGGRKHADNARQIVSRLDKKRTRLFRKSL